MPASADRVLRDERQKGRINYRVIDRRNSYYESLCVEEEPQEAETGDGPGHSPVGMPEAEREANPRPRRKSAASWRRELVSYDARFIAVMQNEKTEP